MSGPGRRTQKYKKLMFGLIGIVGSNLNPCHKSSNKSRINMDFTTLNYLID